MLKALGLPRLGRTDPLPRSLQALLAVTLDPPAPPAGAPAGAALADARALPGARPRPLRTRDARLLPLHVADPALPGPVRSSPGPQWLPSRRRARGGRRGSSGSTKRAVAWKTPGPTESPGWRSTRAGREDGRRKRSGNRRGSSRCASYRRSWARSTRAPSPAWCPGRVRRAGRDSGRRLLRVSDAIDDDFRIDEAGVRLVGRRTKRRFSLGDRVRVAIAFG